LLTLAKIAGIVDLLQPLANRPPGRFDPAVQFDGIGFNQGCPV